MSSVIYLTFPRPRFCKGQKKHAYTSIGYSLFINDEVQKFIEGHAWAARVRGGEFADDQEDEAERGEQKAEDCGSKAG